MKSYPIIDIERMNNTAIIAITTIENHIIDTKEKEFDTIETQEIDIAHLEDQEDQMTIIITITIVIEMILILT